MLSKIHPSRLIYTSFWGIIFGIIFSHVTSIVWCDNIIWLGIAVFLILVCIKFSYRSFALLALVAGLIIGNYRASFALAGQGIYQDLVGQNLTLSGQISEDPELVGGVYKLRLTHLKLQLSSVENTVEPAGTAYVQLAASGAVLERSDVITVSGKLNDGFGAFAATLYRPTLLAIERAEAGENIARLKNWFAELVRAFIPSPASDLGLGYLLGLKSGLPAELADKMRAVGMTHVVVASGAHLGILIATAKRLFGRVSKFAGLLSALLLMGAFVLIVGGTPSMTRAALVTFLSLSFGYVGRKFTPLRLLSFVAMLTLLINPINWLNLGWQLSFASFFGILVLAPRLAQTFYGGKKPPWLASMLLTSAATTITCAPILIFNFGSLSLLAFVANLIILPTLPYAMLLVFLTGATSFWPLVAQGIARLATLLLNLHLLIVDWLSTKTIFILQLPAEQPLIFLLYLPVLGYLIWPKYGIIKA